MDNLTHSLIGATMAELALPREASSRQRSMFYTAGILAANLPDADLLYTSITPGQLGYLLHHRGHTHTVAGLIVLGGLLALFASLPFAKAAIGAARGRFWMLIAAALASHLVADAWNSYGVHPFWPVSNRWYYGDSIFILEPWLWMALGVPTVLNAQRDRSRLLLGGLLVALPVAATAMRMVEVATIAPIFVAAALLAVALRRLMPGRRAGAGLGVAAAFVALCFGLHGVAFARAAGGATPLDLVLSPEPGNPLCWSALRLDRESDAIVMRRGEVRLTRFSPGPCAPKTNPGWVEVARQSIDSLRVAAAGSCPVRAWLQFGRAPVLGNGWISDARFGGTGRGNFSAMPVAPSRSASDCPPHLTPWDMPRADVLSP